MVGRIPAKRVLRLRAQGLSGRAIATSQGVARKSVAAVLEASERLGVSWEDVADREDARMSTSCCSRGVASTAACSSSLIGRECIPRWPGWE